MIRQSFQNIVNPKNIVEPFQNMPNMPNMPNMSNMLIKRC